LFNLLEISVFLILGDLSEYTVKTLFFTLRYFSLLQAQGLFKQTAVCLSFLLSNLGHSNQAAVFSLSSRILVPATSANLPLRGPIFSRLDPSDQIPPFLSYFKALVSHQ